MKRVRRVIYVLPGPKGLEFRTGSVDSAQDIDWRSDGLSVFAAARDASLTVFESDVDPLHSLTVDQVTSALGLPRVDALIIDAREDAIGVLFGSLDTLRELHPVLIYSVAPPGQVRAYDTVEHYMRFIEFASRVGYAVIAIPDKYTYVLVRKEDTDVFAS